MTRAERLHAILSETNAPALLRIDDDSAHHAGHSGATAQGETHFTVLLVSDLFRGQSRVARSRAVHAELGAEFGEPEQGGMHALTLRTPAEQAKLAQRESALIRPRPRLTRRKPARTRRACKSRFRRTDP
jgi:BolA protein